MDQEATLNSVTRHRLALIERLETLDESQWNKASLCVGWRVRDVVGHLVSILELPASAFVKRAFRSRGFGNAVDEIALEFGGRPPESLLSSYRSLADRRMKPPGLPAAAPLTDILVHTRDIERQLGLESRLEQAAMREALLFLQRGRAFGFVKMGYTKGIRFEPTDVDDWWCGSGALLSGPMEPLLMAACGRGSALRDLNGNGVQLLTDRLTAKIPKV